jgi:hypothetical protein
MNLARYLDDPEWHEALIVLIDALQSFLKVDAQYAESFLREGMITRADYERGMAENQPLEAMLTRLKQYEVDRSLSGLLKVKR